MKSHRQQNIRVSPIHQIPTFTILKKIISNTIVSPN